MKTRIDQVHDLLELADYCYGCAAATRAMDGTLGDLYWDEAGTYLEDAMWLACAPDNDLPVACAV